MSIINPLSYPGWDSLLETSNQTTFFHTAAWARVLSESYGYRPLYFTVIENGRLAGLLPVMEIDSFLTCRRGVSLPFTDICHPIADSVDSFQDLLNEVVAYGRKAGWKHIELRGGGRFLIDAAPSAEHFSHLLSLNGDEASLKKSFRESTRRNIRHAEKHGVEVTLSQTRAALGDFYRLHCLTRQLHGLPPQPRPFFLKIHEHIIARDKGFVVLGLHGGKPVAGAVYFHFRSRAIYKLGASDRSFQHLRANNLVMWEAIRWFSRNQFRSLHFGRTELENQGLMQFKNGWRAAEGKVAYFRHDLKQGRFSADGGRLKTSYPLLKKLPIPLLKLAGSVLYRHVG